jgi:hypothetical protein
VPHLLGDYQLPTIPPLARFSLVLAFVIFVVFTAFEAPLRYVFTLGGATWLIYVRDLAMLFAIMVLACQQFWRHQLQPAFIIFGFLLAFHGMVSFLQCGVLIAVLMGLKTLLPLLYGALFLPLLLSKNRYLVAFLIVIWVITAIGIVADFQGYSMPWKGMNATVADYTVVINKKWNYQGEDRIGGFARDSVVAGTITAFIGTYVLLFGRSIIFRALIAVGSLVLIYLTTSKGCLIAFSLVVLACLMPMRRSQLPNKVLLGCIFAMMVLFPITLPNYLMPSSPEILASFFDRVARVWPAAWDNIAMHSWIFGSGMGNIGVGQQFLRFEDVDTGDNLFVLSYGYFGIFSILYLGLPFLAALLRKTPVDEMGRYAIIVLIYIFGYGIVINGIESSIAAFMMGSAFQALALRKIVPVSEFSRSPYRQSVVQQAGP